MVGASPTPPPQLGSPSVPWGSREWMAAVTPGTQDSVLRSAILHSLCEGGDVSTYPRSARQLRVESE